MPRSKGGNGNGNGRRRKHPPKTSEKEMVQAAKASDWEAGSKRGRLLLVATPIGNLGDITLRAVAALKEAAAIACEDTRVTRKLLDRYGIATELTPYHEHNAAKARPRLLARLKAGETIALVTDAGTPLVSDPGYKLVQAAVAEGIPFTALPGPSAVLAALLLSGLPPDRFFFGGFLPAKAEARRREIESLGGFPATLVFFESAKRLPATLRQMAEHLGRRPAAVVREATKLYEEVRRGDLAGLAEIYEREGPPKGEVVIVLGPPEAAAVEDREAEAEKLLPAALRRSSLRDAVDAVAAGTGLGRRRVYALALALMKRDA